MTPIAPPPTGPRRLSAYGLFLVAFVVVAVVGIAIAWATSPGQKSAPSSTIQGPPATYASLQELADRLAVTDLKCDRIDPYPAENLGAATERGICWVQGQEVLLSVFSAEAQVQTELEFHQGLTLVDVAGTTWIVQPPLDQPSWGPRLQGILGGKIYSS